MQLTDDGRRMLQDFEGLSLKAYPDPKLPKLPNGDWDPKQLWSIGYGHQLPPGQNWEGHTIDRAEADRLFRGDVSSREFGVSLVTPVALPHEFDAMVSLAYNIGTGNTTTRQGGFAGSTVARLHNAGDREGAADAFRMWKKSAGADNPVLIRRREKERAIYLNGYSAPSSFPTPLPPQSVDPSWPPIAVAPSSPSSPSSPNGKAYAGASIASLVTLALGWVVYRLIHR